MEAADTDSGSFRIGLIGGSSADISVVLEREASTVDVQTVSGVPDVFELESIDALVIASSNVESMYRQIREIDPYQPIVILDGNDALVVDDEYGSIVEVGDGTIPAALIIARARQLTRQPRTGSRQERSGVTRPIHRERPREFIALWLVAGLTYGFGDTFTTIIGVEGYGLEESNPIVDVVLEHAGMGGFVIMKIGVFGVLLWISLRNSRQNDVRHYYWPPVALIIAGFALTVWNISRILA